MEVKHTNAITVKKHYRETTGAPFFKIKIKDK